MKTLNKNYELDPAGERLIIKPDPIETVTSGGIVLPETDMDRKEDAQVAGTIVAVGAHAWKEYENPWAEVGDHVLYASHAGYSIKVKGETFRVINDLDVTVVLREAE